MTEEAFIERVKAAEETAKRSPRWYKAKLIFLMVLGYVAIFGVFGMLIFLVLGSAALAYFNSTLFIVLLKKKFFLVLLPALWWVMKSLRIKFEEPTGYEATRETFPELWKVVDALSEKLKTPKVHTILLQPGSNAAMEQFPRLGIFGWQRNILFIGIEFLLMLPEDEMRAIIAHELGHLSGNHSRFGGWVYRLRRTWGNILEAVERTGSSGTRLTTAFIKWFAPRFNAHTFAFARENEYEADAASAQILSTSAIGRALIETHTVAPMLMHTYWETFYDQVSEMREPQSLPYSGLKTYLDKAEVSPEMVQVLLDEELATESHYSDTHPGLAQRLAALNVTPDDYVYRRGAPAARWLGEQYDAVIAHFDDEWKEENLIPWAERFEYLEEHRERIAELQTKDRSSLSDAELWELSMRTFEYQGASEAKESFLAFFNRYPEDPDVQFMLGRIATLESDEACLEYFKYTVNYGRYIVDSCRYAYDFCMERGRIQEAEYWRGVGEERLYFENRYKTERAEVTVEDELVKPELSEELREGLAQLKAHKKVGSLWLAQKVVEVSPDEPVYVVAFKARGFISSYEALIREVAGLMQFKDDVFFVVDGDDYRPLARKVMKAGMKLKF